MRLALVYARTQTVELLRFPGFSVATLGFPSLFFLLFGLPRADEHPELLLASYAAFSVIGVGFFQFGVSAAIERDTPWALFLRTLPAGLVARIGGRVVAALGFAAASVAVLAVVVAASTDLHLAWAGWLRLVPTLLVGSVPFVTLGVAIAYWTSAKSALPIANLLYILLSYTGGLWTGPRALPSVVGEISRFTPTRQWGDVLWPAVSGGPEAWQHWLALFGFTCAFAIVAAWGYRRDEGRRFR